MAQVPKTPDGERRALQRVGLVILLAATVQLVLYLYVLVPLLHQRVHGFLFYVIAALVGIIVGITLFAACSRWMVAPMRDEWKGQGRDERLDSAR